MFLKHILMCMLLSLVVILSPSISVGQDNIVNFYKKAMLRIQSAPDESMLSTICEQKVGDKFVAFVSADKQKILLATITKDKLKEPISKSIWLKVRFVGKSSVPAGRPPRGTLDWGYVFDRNRDGKIDYIAYLVGPMPVKRKDFPPDFPKGKGNLNLKQLKLFYKSSQLVFRHWADDNFDGKFDAVVLEDMDTERPFWIERWAVVRSLHYDGMLEEAWYFKEDIETKIKRPERSGNGYKINGIDGPYIFGSDYMDKKSDMLSILNQAANLCKLTKDSFYE